MNGLFMLNGDEIRIFDASWKPIFQSKTLILTGLTVFTILKYPFDIKTKDFIIKKKLILIRK